MADRTSIEEVREMYTLMAHADLVCISVDNVSTLRTVRAANAELSKQLLAERAKVKELEAEVARLRTFSEASAAAVLQLTGKRQTTGLTHGDIEAAERAATEQRELERERQEAQRLGRRQRQVAERELEEREAGRDAVISHFGVFAPDAPARDSGSSGMDLARAAAARRATVREDLWREDYRRDTGMW